MTALFDATKRVCLFTGAGGLLGNAFCAQFAQKLQIVAIYRSKSPRVPSQHQRLVDPLRPKARLPENQFPVFALQADLSKVAEIDRVIKEVLSKFGRVDLLVNAAAHSVWGHISRRGVLHDSLERQFAINTIVPLRLSAMLMQYLWHKSPDQNYKYNRNIVNVSSIAGINIYPGLGQSVYSASKAALNYLTCHMADEFAAFQVRVNATAPNSFPGIIPTERAVRSIITLDQGRMTGKILVIDKDGDNWI